MIEMEHVHIGDQPHPIRSYAINIFFAIRSIWFDMVRLFQDSLLEPKSNSCKPLSSDSSPESLNSSPSSITGPTSSEWDRRCSRTSRPTLATCDTGRNLEGKGFKTDTSTVQIFFIYLEIQTSRPSCPGYVCVAFRSGPPA